MTPSGSQINKPIDSTLSSASHITVLANTRPDFEDQIVRPQIKDAFQFRPFIFLYSSDSLHPTGAPASRPTSSRLAGHKQQVAVEAEQHC